MVILLDSSLRNSSFSKMTRASLARFSRPHSPRSRLMRSRTWAKSPEDTDAMGFPRKDRRIRYLQSVAANEGTKDRAL